MHIVFITHLNIYVYFMEHWDISETPFLALSVH
jgi:hypothetical protein